MYDANRRYKALINTLIQNPCRYRDFPKERKQKNLQNHKLQQQQKTKLVGCNPQYRLESREMQKPKRQSVIED